MTHCLFCKRKTKIEPDEHVALEGLWGHQRFAVQDGADQTEREVYLVLDKGQVCGPCNGDLNKNLIKIFRSN